MPTTYYLEPKEAQKLIAEHVPGEKLPRKGRMLLISSPYGMPTIKIQPFTEDCGKRLFEITVGQ